MTNLIAPTADPAARPRPTVKIVQHPAFRSHPTTSTRGAASSILLGTVPIRVVELRPDHAVTCLA
jgi:hypothetical protein